MCCAVSIRVAFLNSNQPQDSSQISTVSSGVGYAVLAFTAWGLLPVYWKSFGQIPPAEVLSHRILWSTLFLSGLLLIQHRNRAELARLRHAPKHLRVLLTTGLLLAFNWGLYIYAVNTNRVVETSLGYFINPLFNVILGFVFLKERLNRGQKIAVLLAGLGVANFIWQFRAVPAIALVLASSFAFYGLVRKVVPVTPIVGLMVETVLVTPIALVLIGYLAMTGTGHWGISRYTDFLFIGAGVMTSLPLLWFNNAAKRLRLATLGFFQYIAPSLQLLLGVLLYHEPFTRTHALSFGLIWVALAIYSITSSTNKSV